MVSINHNTLFLGEVAAIKKIRNLTNADIAKMTGYQPSTIEAFMAGFRDGEALKKAIASALEIEI